MAASSSADAPPDSPSQARLNMTPRQRLRKAQSHVYKASQSPIGLRCGDLVDVEWEATWYAGVVTDIPEDQTLAVAYANGDFEDSVPVSAAKLRDIPPKKKPPPPKGHGKKDKHAIKLSDAANSGDIGLVLQALRAGSDPKGLDEFGYTPLHWAAAPDDGMPGDTIARRSCIAILARLGDVDARDGTQLGLRGVQHAVTRNYVGCVKTFAYVGADMSGTIHWAQHCKAHASLRELLRLGVTASVHKDLWEGCTPLMLAAAQNDTYGMQMLIDHVEATSGPDAVASFVNASQASGSKLRAAALHHAADAAADLCTQMLLERGAKVEARSSRGETALIVAKRRAQAAEKGPLPETYEAALRCVEALDEATAQAKAERRKAHGFEDARLMLPPPSSGSGTGKRKAKGTGKAAMAAAAAAAAAAASGGSNPPTPRSDAGLLSPGGGGFTDGGYTDGGYTDGFTDGGYTDGGYTDGGAGGTPRADGGGTSGGGTPRAWKSEEGEGDAGGTPRAIIDEGAGGEVEEEEDDEHGFWDRPLEDLLRLIIPHASLPQPQPPLSSPALGGADAAAAAAAAGAAGFGDEVDADTARAFLAVIADVVADGGVGEAAQHYAEDDDDEYDEVDAAADEEGEEEDDVEDDVEDDEEEEPEAEAMEEGEAGGGGGGGGLPVKTEAADEATGVAPMEE